MNTIKTLFSIYLLLILLVSCGSLGLTKKNSATLAWDAAPKKSYIEGYRIYNGTKPGVFDGSCFNKEDKYLEVTLSMLEDINNPKYKIHGLTSDKCFLSITAFTKTKESEKSKSITIQRD